MTKKAPVQIYIARFPFPAKGELVPPARAEEIAACSHPDVRRAKFYVWKLLERALLRSFGLAMGELDLKKTECGKWECSACCFSLSHSGDLAAVAVSEAPVGVDIERWDEARFTPTLAKKILTAREAAAMEQLDEGARAAALNALWTKKEALFKRIGKGAFLPRNVETSDGETIMRAVLCEGNRYLLSVASEIVERADFFCGEGVEVVEID